MSSYTSDNKTVEIVKYADDVTIILPVFKNSFDDLSILNSEITHFRIWCQKHQMLINDQKTKLMNINSLQILYLIVLVLSKFVL